MKRKTKFKIFGQLRKVYNVMMGIAYLAVCYLFILFASNHESFHDMSTTIILISLCGMAQISHYHDAYKEARKDINYYIGVVPPNLALLCILYAVTKIYFFG